MSNVEVVAQNTQISVNPTAASPVISSSTQIVNVNKEPKEISVGLHTYHISISPSSSKVDISTTKQTILIGTPSSSVAIVSAGPMGPRGPVGPADLSSYLTIDGQLLTRSGGNLAPITRVDLASDPAFISLVSDALSDHVLLSDPHPVYMTSAEVDASFVAHAALVDPHTQYVAVAGDTMTGRLNGTDIRLTGITEAIRLSSTDSFISFYNGAVRTGYIQGHSSGMILSGEVGTLQIVGATITISSKPTAPGVSISGTNSVSWASYGGGWFMQDTTWVRTFGGKSIYAGSGIIATDGAMSIVRGGAVTSGYVLDVNGNILGTANLVIASQITSQRNTIADPLWSNSSFLASPGAGGTGIAFHAGGTAPQFRIAQNDNHIYARDAGGINHVPIGASAFEINSTRRSKQDIRSWPAVLNSVGSSGHKERLSNRIKKVRTVSFRRKEEYFMSEVPSNEEDQKDRSKYKTHQCKKDKCGGTKNNPCSWRKGWERGEIGFIAEELAEVFPEAVVYDSEGKPEAISLGSLMGAIVAVVQELDLRLDELEEGSNGRNDD